MPSTGPATPAASSSRRTSSPLTKKDLGLPNIADATERQKRDGMCWTIDGRTLQRRRRLQDHLPRQARDRRHHHRRQLLRLLQEGGENPDQLRRQSLRQRRGGTRRRSHRLPELRPRRGFLAQRLLTARWTTRFARRHQPLRRDSSTSSPRATASTSSIPTSSTCPEDVHIDLHSQTVTWTNDDGPQKIPLQPGITYVLPSGYKVEMVKPTAGQRWRLIGTTAEGTFCHKPCTVSGGGKSEISKSLSDAMITASRASSAI